MVLAETLCAINVAASAMIDGMCCCYQMNEESKRQKDHERAIQNAFRTELETRGNSNSHSDTNNDVRKDSTINTKNIARKNSSNDLVQAYKDALSSRWQDNSDHDHVHDHKYQQMAQQTANRYYHERDQPPQQQQQQQGYSSQRSRSGSSNNNNRNRYPMGIPARHQSFSSIKTKQFDNREEQAPVGNGNDDDHDDLMAQRQHSSFLFLAPIRQVSSLLEDIYEDEDNSHDWLQWDKTDDSNNNKYDWNNNDDMKFEEVCLE